MENFKKQIVEEVKNLNGVELIKAIKEKLPKGKNKGQTCYILINEKHKAIRVANSSIRWANNLNEIFKSLGYSTDLDCRLEGTILV
jgi:hypothetical protein